MKKITFNIIFDILRYIVGGLFVFSGLVKANDPLGLAYKMQEFFVELHLTFLNSSALNIATFIIVFEILVGLSLMIKYYFKTAIYLFLGLTFFFLFITGYAVISGNIKSCGCFGDCIPLTPIVSFIKDVVLFLIALFFFITLRKKNIDFKYRKVKHYVFWVVFVTIIFGQVWVLNHLPFVDCLPYKKGTNLYAKLTKFPNHINDSTVIYFTYKYRNKEEVVFDALSFPPDFNDTDYVFINRKDVKISKRRLGGDYGDFVLQNQRGSNVTFNYINRNNNTILVCVLNPESLNKEIISNLDSLYKISYLKGISFVLLTSDVAKLIAVLDKYSYDPNGVEILQTDKVILKTLARSDITIYNIRKGIIANKWGKAHLDDIVEFNGNNNLKNQ